MYRPSRLVRNKLCPSSGAHLRGRVPSVCEGYSKVPRGFEDPKDGQTRFALVAVDLPASVNNKSGSSD
jgi:hypothetical protein